MELSKQLGINQSTVSRLVATLESVGYLQRMPDTGKLRVGLRIAGLAFVALSRIEIRRTCLTVLEMLADAVHLNSTLAVMEYGRAIYIARVEAPQLARGNYVLGREAPLHCSAVGKLLLAHAPPEEALELMTRYPLPAHTPSTITSVDRLREELHDIRERGYAFDHNEWLDGVVSIAVPVQNQSGQVIAAVAVSGPTSELVATGTDSLLNHVQEAARRISYGAGYSRAYV